METLCQLFPDSPYPFVHLARFNSSLGNYKAALENITEALTRVSEEDSLVKSHFHHTLGVIHKHELILQLNDSRTAVSHATIVELGEKASNAFEQSRDESENTNIHAFITEIQMLIIIGTNTHIYFLCIAKHLGKQHAEGFLGYVRENNTIHPYLFNCLETAHSLLLLYPRDREDNNYFQKLQSDILFFHAR